VRRAECCHPTEEWGSLEAQLQQTGMEVAASAPPLPPKVPKQSKNALELEKHAQFA